MDHEDPPRKPCQRCSKYGLSCQFKSVAEQTAASTSSPSIPPPPKKARSTGPLQPPASPTFPHTEDSADRHSSLGKLQPIRNVFSNPPSPSNMPVPPIRQSRRASTDPRFYNPAIPSNLSQTPIRAYTPTYPSPPPTSTTGYHQSTNDYGYPQQQGGYDYGRTNDNAELPPSYRPVRLSPSPINQTFGPGTPAGMPMTPPSSGASTWSGYPTGMPAAPSAPHPSHHPAYASSYHSADSSMYMSRSDMSRTSTPRPCYCPGPQCVCGRR
jgi:hypothetical protein